MKHKITIKDLPYREKEDYEKHYTFEDIKGELYNFGQKEENRMYGNSEILFFAHKIVELTNKNIELENKIKELESRLDEH